MQGACHRGLISNRQVEIVMIGFLMEAAYFSGLTLY